MKTYRSFETHRHWLAEMVFFFRIRVRNGIKSTSQVQRRGSLSDKNYLKTKGPKATGSIPNLNHWFRSSVDLKGCVDLTKILNLNPLFIGGIA